MSQRNPMNERYTTDAKAGGSSRKSAASAKPKSSAASSVVVGAKTKKKNKTAGSNKSTKRQERERQYRQEQKYGDPPWKKFKIMKRIWIGTLISSVFCVAASFGVSHIVDQPDGIATGFIIAAYISIILTLYIDLGQIRRMRKKWVSIMSSTQTKEARAEQKRLKAEARAAAKEAEQKAKEDAENKESKSVDSTFADKIKSFFKTK